jgi:hypothetical protein
MVIMHTFKLDDTLLRCNDVIEADGTFDFGVGSVVLRGYECLFQPALIGRLQHAYAIYARQRCSECAHCGDNDQK